MVIRVRNDSSALYGKFNTRANTHMVSGEWKSDSLCMCEYTRDNTEATKQNKTKKRKPQAYCQSLSLFLSAVFVCLCVRGSVGVRALSDF